MCKMDGYLIVLPSNGGFTKSDFMDTIVFNGFYNVGSRILFLFNG